MSNDKILATETPIKTPLPEVEAPEELTSSDLDDVAGGCETNSTGVGCLAASGACGAASGKLRNQA